MSSKELIEQHHQGELLASARWADPAYIASKYQFENGAIWLGRNPHNPDQAIGIKDDRHVFLNAETRTGKGRSFLVNNQVLWPGSLVAIGPKGEEATITAIRRGDGNEQEHCPFGLSQEVYVLDPMRCADVPDGLRAFFNPLAELDPNDEELVSKADRVAAAICRMPDGGGDSAEWARHGRDWVSVLIQHVVTFPFFHEEERTLLKVRELAMQGNVEGAEHHYKLRQEKAEKEGRDPNSVSKPHPYRVLLDDMISLNKQAARGNIALNASDLLQSLDSNGKLYDSVRRSASDHLRWLGGGGIQKTVARINEPGSPNRTFRVSDIKHKRISVFVHLPEGDYDTLDRWLRAMVVVLLQGLQKEQGLPANGERVLFCIDEFANLGEMEMVGKAINSIAGAGVKLMIATQRVGDLQRLYNESWEKFISSAAQLWFGAEEMATRKYLEEKLGNTQIEKFAKSIQHGASTTITEGVSESYSHTNSQNTSSAFSQSKTQGLSTTEGRSISKGKTRGRSQNYSYGDGKSATKNYGPAIFFNKIGHFWKHTLSEGESQNHSRGVGTNSNRSRNVTDSKTESVTTSETDGFTFTEGQGSSDTHQKGSSYSDARGTSDTAGITQSFHVKPLLSSSEIREYLAPIDELEHPAYPGFALVILPSELPFFVRRSNHDQDPFFIGKFRPNPTHEFVPFDKQPLLGWQITEEFFFHVSVPEDLTDFISSVRISRLEPGRFFSKGHQSFSLYFERSIVDETDLLGAQQCLKSWKYSNHENSMLRGEKSLTAPFDFKIIETYEPSDGMHELLTVRANFAITEAQRDQFEKELWQDVRSWKAYGEEQLAKKLAEKTARKNRLKELTNEEDRLVRLYKKEKDKLRWTDATTSFFRSIWPVFWIIIIVSIIVIGVTNNLETWHFWPVSVGVIVAVGTLAQFALKIVSLAERALLGSAPEKLEHISNKLENVRSEYRRLKADIEELD